jgi:hypothetical protein
MVPGTRADAAQEMRNGVQEKSAPEQISDIPAVLYDSLFATKPAKQIKATAGR